MIKYVELTAPEASAYRQAKILSIVCREGDQIKTGDTLFIVQSGNTKLDLPSTQDGRIVEFIVSEQENITLSTPLLLLETVVESSTAKPVKESPTQAESLSSSTKKEAQGHKPMPPKKQAKRTPSEQIKTTKRHEQQSLDLLAGLNTANESTNTASGCVPTMETTENNSMSKTNSLTINVPDIGADSAKVIEILVQVGDQVSVEDALVTLESDKASMDVPSPYSGRVRSISVLIDQDVSEGTTLLELEVDESSSESTPKAEEAIAQAAPTKTEPKPMVNENTTQETVEQTIEITIPDIGGDSAKVVDILVAAGDEVAIEDALITLESDKASMDVPSIATGIIKSIEVSVDDDVSEGTLVATLTATSASNVSEPANTSSAKTKTAPATNKPAETITTQAAAPAPTNTPPPAVAVTAGDSHASPSIRRFARELGVDLNQVTGSGRKSRVTKDDVKAFVKGALVKSSSTTPATSGAGIPAVPAQDFSKFGDIEVSPLNKIKRLTAENLHRSWLNVPHVTHNDESNINDLESFRKQINAEYAKQNKGIKLSPLAFIVKAVVNALQTYPQFNSSLEPGGENLILKKYFNVGIAVDTPNGLVVPVIRNADTKSVAQIAQEMGELAEKARNKKLTMNDMSGACITISSLGGIGGTSFTPIVNAPEVAILGVSRSKIQPVWNGKEFIPGMMLPLSLSYDHRVIDGAEAARFTRHIAAVLEDVRRLTV